MRAHLLGLAIFVVALVLVTWLHDKVGFAVDDGFIVLRYTSNLLNGHGLVFNPGERVEGFSSPLWVFLLAGLGGFFQFFAAPSPERLELLNRGLGIFAAAGVVWATFAFVRSRMGLPLVYQLGAAGGVLFSWPAIFWSGAGLETPLFSLLLLLIAARLTGKAPFTGRRGVTTVALLVALGICRPEGPLFAALAGASAWKISPIEERRKATFVLARAAVFLALCLGARYAYYGELLPNTYYAKVGGGPLVLLRGAFYLYDYLWRGGGLALGGLAMLGVLTLRKSKRPEELSSHLPALVVLATALGFILIVGGDGLYCFRFIVHFLPLLCAYAALGAYAIESRLRAMKERTAPWLGAAALVVAVCLGFQPFLDDEGLLYGARNHWFRESERAWSELGRSLRVLLSPNSLLATNIAGKVPYESRLPTLDMLGLTDRTIARTKVETMGRGYAGHEKANVPYLLERMPAVIFISVLERLPVDVFRNAKECGQVLASTSLHAYAPLLSKPKFLENYVPALVHRETVAPAAVFLRADVVHQVSVSGPTVRVLDWVVE